MCGIAGIYSLQDKLDTQWIRVMTDTLKHRGPDDEGFLAVNTKKKLAFPLKGDETQTGNQPGPHPDHINGFQIPVDLLLGHRRLSILDLSILGHQPMSTKDGQVWGIYNGEIYNYRELRDELKKRGYVFRTNTDTEVLLSAYEEWGKECLSRFNGMWAFVIYDLRENILFGARDRFGVKPFYYLLNSNYFLFSSEIKSLLRFPSLMTGVNSRAVFDYLVFGWEEREEEGMFKGILELLPSYAFIYCLSDNSFTKWRYYRLPFTDNWEGFAEKKFHGYREGLRQRIFRAVSMRLRSDVPVGSCLSGGIDSSSIVCAINTLLQREKIEQIGERQMVFTASYKDDPIDESKWARIVVEHTRTSWHRTFPKAGEFLDDLENLVYIQDIPFGSSSIYAQYRVMQLAKEQGIKVLLDGQGGDELFAGYKPYYRAFFAEIIKNLDLPRFFRELRGLDNSPIDIKFLFNSLLELAGVIFLPLQIKKPILKNSGRRKRYLNPDFWEDNSQRLERLGNRSTSLNQMLYELLVNYNLKSLLRYEDRNSMKFSIESRTPFSDDLNLIEYAFGIPSVYKIHQGWSKFILREAMQGIVMEEVLRRKDKIGFATPELLWLKSLKDELRSYINHDLSQFLNPEEVLKDWDTLFTRPSKKMLTNLWRFINFAVWKKVYNL